MTHHQTVHKIFQTKIIVSSKIFKLILMNKTCLAPCHKNLLMIHKIPRMKEFKR